MTQQAPSSSSCEVIILTALPDECQAVLYHLRERQEVLHPSGTVYHRGIFVGDHRIWHVAVAEIGMGGVSAALEAEKALTFFSARIALFVGVAGGLKNVHHGDVVAATKVYVYESGKAAQHFDPRPELGHPSHALEQRARAEAHQDRWLARLGGSRPDPAPQVFMGALAAGEKVLASKQSNLARLLKKNYSDALAIEMEGHGFLHAVRANHSVHGLVIRGISDLIDDKIVVDAAGGQVVAARHAAAFAFQVLATFTLPSGSEAARIPASSLLNLPFPQNLFFTGREAELQALHIQLWQQRYAAIGQTRAISGLGGIGKTQLAVEYAYRHHNEYQYILWARAESVEALTSSFIEIAHVLDLPGKDAQEQAIPVQAVTRWLQQRQNWLLILDNADHPDLLSAFLPSTVGGHLLITTRAADLSAHLIGLAHPLVLDPFSDERGALFLLHRSGFLASSMTLDQVEGSDRQLALEIAHELGGLPLALDQAGAYLYATGSSLVVYQYLYQKHRTQLLNDRRGAKHSASVATTWNISFQNVEQQSPAAADLLRLCAFLAPEAIPESILTMGVSELGSILAPVAADPFLLNDAIERLRAYSLITRDPQAQTLAVHRLVQTVLRDSMAAETQRHWMQCTVGAVNAAFPDVAFEHWPACERMLPHARICAIWVEQAALTTPEAIRLLNQAGYYLHERARYTEAEPLLQHALAIHEQQLGATHPDIAASLNNLALLYETLGKYAEAEPLYQRALAIREQQLGEEHPDTATCLNNLALLYQVQGKYAEAEPLYQRALAIREQQLGATHPSTAQSLNNLALLYKTQGKYAEAEPLYRRALAIREQQLGATHPDTAQSLNNLAALYKTQGKYAEAEPLYLRALAIREQQLGAIHPSTATSLNNLAALYQTQGKYAEAEPLYQRALAIREQQLGATHPDTAQSLNNLAALYQVREKYAEAEPLYQRALAIREQQLGTVHPSTAQSLNNLAALYKTQGKYAEAEPLYQRALAIDERALGQGHPNTQQIRKNYALLLQAKERDVGVKGPEEGP